ncbi:MAG TPA: hypothetical protein VGK67_01825 [Myxococcales bacterium]|jgi:hypothetical protein
MGVGWPGRYGILPAMNFALRNCRPGLLLAACLGIASAVGCPSAPAAGPDAAPIPQLPDVGIAVVDAGPPAPPGLDAGPAPLKFKARALTDAGVLELAVDAANEIPVESRFEVELGAVKDVRVRLFDEADKAVPSTDKLEVGQATTRYQLAPNEPLTPGSGYALVIDGLKAFEATDSSGKSLEVTKIGMWTLGEKPAPPASAKSGKSAKAKKKTKKK